MVDNGIWIYNGGTRIAISWWIRHGGHLAQSAVYAVRNRRLHSFR